MSVIVFIVLIQTSLVTDHVFPVWTGSFCTSILTHAYFFVDMMQPSICLHDHVLDIVLPPSFWELEIVTIVISWLKMMDK